MDALQPIPQERVVDTVRSTLRRAILEGDLPPGARLSVPELARRLNVSRSPVREAVLLLVSEGLAIEHSRRGVEVAHVAGCDLREIQAVRTVLEGLAARLCAEQLGEHDLTELRALLAQQATAANENDGAAYRELDACFHTLLVERAGNGRLARLAKLLAAEMRVASRVMADVTGHAHRGHAEHCRIVDAIERHDPTGAECAMREHLERVANDTLNHMNSTDEPSHHPPPTPGVSQVPVSDTT